MTILGLSPYWLITPVLFIIIGVLFVVKPPNKINELYGYRTKRAKKTQIHWNLAQRTSGIYFLFSGIFLTIIALLALFLIPEEYLSNPFLVFGMIGFQLIHFPIMFLIVETKLKKIEVNNL